MLANGWKNVYNNGIAEKRFKGAILISGADKKQTKRIRSAYPLYASALIWLFMGLFTPIYKGTMILLAAALSAGVYFALSAFVFKGRVVEVENPIATGDQALDKQLSEGRRQLAHFEEIASGLADGEIGDKLRRIAKTGRLIIDEVANDKREAGDLQTFFSYYLPTIEKLLKLYQKMSGLSVRGENIDRSIRRVEDSLDMIAQSFDKELDSLYKNEAMDIKVDIKVLETMLKSEGLLDETKPAKAETKQTENQTMEGV